MAEEKKRTFKATRMFPKESIENALKLAKAIKKDGREGAIENTILGSAIGLKPGGVQYRTLVNAAVCYGLIKGSGSSSTLSLTQLSKDILYPIEHIDEKVELRRAFNNIDLFAQLIEEYNGKELPKGELFSNILMERYQLPENSTKKCIEIFKENAEYVGLIQNISGTDFIEASPEQETKLPREKPKEGKPNVEKSSKPTENVGEKLKVIGMPDVHIDIQIHISPDTTSTQIEQIFSCMAKHLYNKKEEK